MTVYYAFIPYTIQSSAVHWIVGLHVEERMMDV